MGVVSKRRSDDAMVSFCVRWFFDSTFRDNLTLVFLF
jgi:hypothetical protein